MNYTEPIFLSAAQRFEKMAGIPAGYDDDSFGSDEDEIVFADDEGFPYAEQNGHVHDHIPERSVPYQPAVKSLDRVSGRPLEDIRIAASQGNVKVLEQLLQEGIHPDATLKGHWTPLLQACTAGAADVVDLLLRKGANPNFSHDGVTPLVAACGSRKDSEDSVLACVESLLRHGAECKGHDRQGVTPLMLCAREGYLRVMQCLLDEGTSVDAQDSRGWTALCWAAHEGQGRAARLLMRFKPDPVRSVTLAGQTPSDLALLQGYDILADILSKYETKGEPGNAEVKDALTPRWSASVSGDVELFLGSLNLCHLVEVFQKHKIDFTQLLELDDHEALIEMGIDSVEEREKILEAVRTARKFHKPHATKSDKAGAGDVSSFLSALGLSSLQPLFQKISWDKLVLMDDPALKKVGVSQVGPRRKILEGIRKVHLSPWQKSSLRDLRHSKNITCPDAVSLMSNITSHLRHVVLSVRFLRQEIVKDPNILALGRDLCNVRHLDEGSREAREGTQALTQELDALLQDVARVSGTVDFLPHWPPTQKDAKKNGRRTAFGAAVVVVAAGAAFWFRRVHRAAS
ncbi:uncharacterized protein LOC135387976 isoform X2 [Ornithodoros turicata]|uniref:uncharacterized protein LOC135387976 isoform X2 n=1 Tax=Ornithodoros turicata TaxID=34597 RepID=UPI0031397723